MAEIRTDYELRSIEYNYFIVLKLNATDKNPRIIEKAISEIRGKADDNARGERLKKLIPDMIEVMINDATYDGVRGVYRPNTGARKRESEAAVRFKLNEIMELVKNICETNHVMFKSQLMELCKNANKEGTYFTFPDLEREFNAYKSGRSVQFVDDVSGARLPFGQFDDITEMLQSLKFKTLYDFLGISPHADVETIKAANQRTYSQYISKSDRSLKTIGKNLCGNVTVYLCNEENRSRYDSYASLRESVWRQLALRRQFSSRTMSMNEYNTFAGIIQNTLHVPHAEAVNLLNGGLRFYGLTLTGSASGGEEQTKTCPACGAQNAVGAKFCAECGHSFNIPTPKPVPTPKPSAPPPKPMPAPKPVTPAPKPMPAPKRQSTPIETNSYEKYLTFDRTYGRDFWYVSGLSPAAPAGLSEITVPNVRAAAKGQLPVSEIVRNAFKGNISLKRVTLPPNMKRIFTGVFENCTQLESINIESVEEIHSYAFNGCTRLKKIYFHGSAADWTDAEKIKVHPQGNLPLLNATVYFYSPTRPAAAGHYWHYDESGKVEEYVTVTPTPSPKPAPPVAKPVRGETDLDWLEFPHVGFIPEDDYMVCAGRKMKESSNYPASVKIPAKVFNRPVKSVHREGFRNLSGLKSVILPGEITNIGQMAFSDCRGLESIVIPKKLAVVEDFAFSCCFSLKKVYYYGSEADFKGITVKPKNNEAFINAQRYYFSSSKPAVEGNFWHVNSKGEVVEYPPYVPQVPKPAAPPQPPVQPVKPVKPVKPQQPPIEVKRIPAPPIEVKKIPTTPIEVKKIPATPIRTSSIPIVPINTPSSRKYTEGEKVIDVTFAYVTHKDEKGGYYYGIQLNFEFKNNPNRVPPHISLPERFAGLPVRAVEPEGFACSGIVSVTVPNGVRQIGADAFRNCKRLERAELPDTLVEICASAFRNCRALKSINIPASVQQMGALVFAESGLESADISALPKAYLTNAAFGGCKHLKSVVACFPQSDIEAFEGSKNVKFVYSVTDLSEYQQSIQVKFKKAFKRIFPKATYYAFSPEAPAKKGNFWRFVDGKPVKW